MDSLQTLEILAGLRVAELAREAERTMTIRRAAAAQPWRASLRGRSARLLLALALRLDRPTALARLSGQAA